MIERVRRVVMGEPEPGKSAFTHVEEVEPLAVSKTSKWWLVWGWDKAPTLPHADTEPYIPRSLFPPPGGLRVWAQRIADGTPLDTEEERDAVKQAVARLRAGDPPGGWYDDPAGRPGMHRTDSFDIAVVVSGEITTIADDGSRVVLGPGDVYTQNGALHSWESDPDNPAHVVFILLGAERVE
jgi:uncharacterized cupin superfamily protein